MTPEEKISTLLTKNGHKVTNTRKKVYLALLGSSKPLENTELISLLPEVDKVSVYRTIALFESIGVVHRIWNGFKSKIEIAEEHSPHHHHFTCSVCGFVKSFDDDNVEHAPKLVEKRLNVQVNRHLIELGGRCHKCIAKETSALA